MNKVAKMYGNVLKDLADKYYGKDNAMLQDDGMWYVMDLGRYLTPEQFCEYLEGVIADWECLK